MTVPAVAALYVVSGGVYFGRPDVDPWDEARDARLYSGPLPVIAHPPCAAWSRYAHARAGAWGLPAFEDGGCFAAAVEAVRRFGGVLEHPAASYAWERHGLPRPARRQGWCETLDGQWVAELDQAAYGHRLRKPTWLHYVGAIAPRPLEQLVPVGRSVDDVTSSWRNPTPPAFAEYLIGLARDSRCATVTA